LGVAIGDADATGVGVAAAGVEAGTGADDGPLFAGGVGAGTFATGPAGLEGAKSG
jgi:hypothetical protein